MSKEQEALDTMCKWIEDEIYLIKEENLDSMSILRKSSSYFEIKKALQKAINDLEIKDKALEIIIKKILCVSNEEYEKEFKFWIEKAKRAIELERELEDGK